MKADQIIEEARKCLKTPFQHQGRIPGLALDCVGLCIVVARNLGIEVIDQTGYGRTPSNGLLETAIDNQPALYKVTDGTKKRGDIFAMRWLSDPKHVAIFEGTNIIHSYAEVGMVCEHGFTPEWQKRVIATYRFKDVEE